MVTSPLTQPTDQDGPWTSLVRALVGLQRNGGRLLFIANPGNVGDALIASATWQLMEDLHLRPQSSRLREIREGDVVIFGGGGNLVPLYRNAADCLDAGLARGVARFILLPHTVRGHEELLSRLDGRFTLFCRDRASHEHVLHHAPNANAAMAPDMALRLDVGRLQARAERSAVHWKALWAMLRSGHWRRYRRWLELSQAILPDASGHLDIFRSDAEAQRLPGPKSRDLSGLYDSALRSRDECDSLSAQFLGVIGRARSVRTDRLHVAIGAQLLRLPVELLDNSYGKNHAVVGAFPELLPSVRLLGSPDL